ncbi:glutamyl-tRNA amidotransferase [candidate division WWE3 bacterium CG_4_9_14_3_um_filter_34_6]|uniref:Glutamyl-tRNA amidotransferase n=1 Tax=candidate division WWE3 bacterium CG_4_9_14_3_um_filter_34_6 TaxID=1975079 RepID=A0A2M7X4N7_UNCKA|nr:MAG: glutamyl-tRNA amidotransferase [candidate division WWE3 bacterium CG_4_9_14_3_um_filter_34_6]
MLLEKLQQDQITAMKSGDKARLGVLRMMISELKNMQIELKAKNVELDDVESLKVLTKEAKKRKDSILAFESANRLDLSEIEKAELLIVEEYLPKQLSEDEIQSVVAECASNIDTKDFGSVMKMAMEKLKGRVDGKIVSELVKKALSF